ncbi:MAG TPA: ice-binding family protein [Acidimicrobiia bacterium]|nr:ice-binding family protein [Acidimicrobiia bacterium]
MRLARTPRDGVLVRRVTIITLLLLPILVLGAAMGAAQVTVGLGTAGNFAVLAGTTITNTGPTTITGDVGLHPGNSVTGFDSVTLNGEQHLADAVALQAKNDLVTAYDQAAASLPVTTVGTELGGQTLTAGAYNSADGTFGITGTLTLNAEGDPNAVFVFKMASTLTTASASVVNVINGANACNVFWQVGSSATLGTGTVFRGNILALTSITLTTGASIEGRALARNGAVTMDTNTITQAACTQQMTPTTTTTTTTAPVTPVPTTLAPPVGGVDTGGGSTAGPLSVSLLVIGGALVASAVGGAIIRRRLHMRRDESR